MILPGRNWGRIRNEILGEVFLSIVRDAHAALVPIPDQAGDVGGVAQLVDPCEHGGQHAALVLRRAVVGEFRDLEDIIRLASSLEIAVVDEHRVGLVPAEGSGARGDGGIEVGCCSSFPRDQRVVGFQPELRFLFRVARLDGLVGPDLLEPLVDLDFLPVLFRGQSKFVPCPDRG